MTRLEAISRAMREAFTAASDAQRVRASRTACEDAVEATDLAGADVEAALAALRQQVIPEAGLSLRFREEAERHDAAQLELEQTEGPSDASQLRFRQARAASALAEALDGDVAEAMYEAIYAEDDVESAIARVIESLRA